MITLLTMFCCESLFFFGGDFRERERGILDHVTESEHSGAYCSGDGIVHNQTRSSSTICNERQIKRWYGHLFSSSVILNGRWVSLWCLVLIYFCFALFSFLGGGGVGSVGLAGSRIQLRSQFKVDDQRIARDRRLTESPPRPKIGRVSRVGGSSWSE